MLNVTNLGFSYPSSPQEDFIFDLSVARGQIVVVEGRSGIGKSTLLNLIAGFLKPSSGQITWKNNDKSQDLTLLKPQDRPLSMIFQEGNLFDHLTVRDNIALGLNPSLALNPREWQAVDAAMQDLGIFERANRSPDSISGGQQQRVALARALIRAEWQDCHLLLFDEPFSALDTETRLDCIAVVKKLVKEKNFAALMVSHDPEDAKRLAAKTISL